MHYTVYESKKLVIMTVIHYRSYHGVETLVSKPITARYEKDWKTILFHRDKVSCVGIIWVE